MHDLLAPSGKQHSTGTGCHQLSHPGNPWKPPKAPVSHTENPWKPWLQGFPLLCCFPDVVLYVSPSGSSAHLYHGFCLLVMKVIHMEVQMFSWKLGSSSCCLLCNSFGSIAKLRGKCLSIYQMCPELDFTALISATRQLASAWCEA